MRKPFLRPDACCASGFGCEEDGVLPLRKPFFRPDSDACYLGGGGDWPGLDPFAP